MVRAVFQYLAFGVAYFAAAALPIALTRLEGGVALLWIATALLTAKLRTTDRQTWPWWLSIAGSASVVATGLFGLGWAAAVPMMALNLLDAWLAQRVLSSFEARRGAVSAEWQAPAIIAACVAGAMVTAIPAATVTMLATGTSLSGNAMNWLLGHALGSLTFGPFMHLCVRGQMRPWLVRVLTGRDPNSLAAVGLLVAVCAVSFSQHNQALLFLPVLAFTVLSYSAGVHGAALGSVIVGVIGGGLTLASHAGMGFATPAATFQFFQFYLGITMLTLLPVSVVVTARDEMTKSVRRSEASYRLLADNIEDVVVNLDLHGRLTYASPSIGNFAGQAPLEMVGSSVLDMIEPGFQAMAWDSLVETIARRGEPLTFEFVGAAAGEQKRWFEMQGRCVLGEGGEPVGVVGTIRETSARKLLETALRSAAETDQLTGVFNRRAFLDAARATAQNSVSSCLAVFDIDHLRAINMVHGIEAGDLALSSFGEVGRRTLRERDLLGRLEGDSFALLLPNTTLAQAEAHCERLLTALAGERIRLSGRPLEVTASAGLARLTGDFDDALQVAHEELESAKAGGRARVSCLGKPQLGEVHLPRKSA